MNKVAFAGSFDPITNGHLWVIQEALNIADKVVVMVAHNPSKKYMFSSSEKLSMIEESLLELGIQNRVEVKTINNEYVAQTALREGCSYLIRGIRSSNDFDYESLLQKTNTEILEGAKTIFVMPPRELESVSSSYVKSLIGPINWHNIIKNFVPSGVYRHFIHNYIKEVLYNYVAGSEAGKRILDNHLEEVLQKYQGRPYHNVDHIVHCLQEFEAFVKEGTTSIYNKEDIVLAILFHDVIYGANDSQKSDEELSADYWVKLILKYTEDETMKKSVKNLILSTDYKNESNYPFASLIKSIDLSILGQSPKYYQQYANNIRKEYLQYDEETFANGRIKVLNKLLEKEKLYEHEAFSHYEAPARKNIMNEIEYLSKKRNT